MSLTEQVVEELYSLPLNKSCCQKAFICGMLIGSKKNETGKGYDAFFYRKEDAERAVRIIDTRFSSGGDTEIRPQARGGHRGYCITFTSKALTGILMDIDNGKKTDADTAVGFRCAECGQQFLKGAFISTAVISNPKNGYHLELSLSGDGRADILHKYLSENVCPAGRIKRSGGRIGLYYKSNSKIADLLYYIGAVKSSFDVANVSIERDIRNNENRATNCVTRNISASVAATRKHIDAINYLERTEKIALLSDELAYTARLRLENDSASLSELAMLHHPPISKSGLNGRLSKILAVAEEVKQKTESGEN